MIIKGYLIIFTYIFSILFVFSPLVKKITNGEISRKFIHISIFAVWIMLEHYLMNTIHQIIISIIFLIVNILSYKFRIFKSMERQNGNDYGTIYFALALTVIMTFVFFFPQFYYCSGIAVFSLTFGDGLAAVIGQNLKSPKIYQNKSLLGFITCLLATFMSVTLFNYFYNINLTIFMILLLSAAVAIFELIGNGLDNLSVVFISFIMAIIFITIPSSALLISICLAEIIFLAVFFSKSIDYYGSLLSMLMSFSFLYFGGIIGICVLLGEFLTLYILDLIRKKFTNSPKKKAGRKFIQILINAGLGTIFIILYGIFKSTSLLIISIISLSGCFIDSISSDVGTLSKKDPYDLLKRKKVPKGLSGGVSFLGTFSSLIVATIISLLLYVNLHLNMGDFILITALIFGQTVIDSILGSLLQVKYKCSKCGKITESGECCNKSTKQISGISWINNNAINAISSVIITILAILFYW